MLANMPRHPPATAMTTLKCALDDWSACSIPTRFYLRPVTIVSCVGVYTASLLGKSFLFIFLINLICVAAVTQIIFKQYSIILQIYIHYKNTLISKIKIEIKNF